MVANYTEVRSATLDAEAPVPATFRAHAIDRFNAARDGDHQLYLDWLGVPGREIAKAPQDPATAEAIGHAAATGQTAPRSEWLDDADGTRSEEHTSELQSLMRNSYAVFCLKKKTK